MGRRVYVSDDEVDELRSGERTEQETKGTREQEHK
jgi:hypothetical protein